MAQYGKTLQEERATLAENGFESAYILRLRPKRPWIRADNTLVGELPIDPYHFARFMTKGWRIAPTDWVAPPPVEKEPLVLGVAAASVEEPATFSVTTVQAGAGPDKEE